MACIPLVPPPPVVDCDKLRESVVRAQADVDARQQGIWDLAGCCHRSIYASVSALEGDSHLLELGDDAGFQLQPTLVESPKDVLYTPR